MLNFQPVFFSKTLTSFPEYLLQLSQQREERIPNANETNINQVLHDKNSNRPFNSHQLDFILSI
jgi:hypothetical protein